MPANVPRAAALEFHQLTYMEDGDEVVVGRRDNDSYAVFPRDGAALLRELAAGRSPDDAASWYAEQYGEPADMADFLGTLRELGFTRDGHEEAAGAVAPAANPGKAMRRQRLGKAVFSPPAWAAYGLLVAATLAIWAADPRFLPRRGNLFYSHYLLLVEATATLGVIPLLLVHELFHVIAGWRLGLSARVRVSRRFYFVVFETVMDGLVIMPRGRRYLPIVAGMLADVLTMCALTAAAWLTRRPDGSVPLAGGVFLALAFTAVPRLLWQFYFFLRTDVYYLVTTVLGCVDLHRTARELLGNRLRALLGRAGRQADESRWHPRDAAAARWYAPLMTAGYLAFGGTLILVVIPVMWRLLATAVATAADPAAPPARFWDASGLLALNIGQFAVGGALAWRRRRRSPSSSRRRNNSSQTPGGSS
jgi:hypothetical protein